MSQAKGHRARFSYVNEVEWGTTPATPSMKQIAAATYGETLGGTIGELESQAIRATRGRGDIRGGDINVAGSVPFELAPLGLASLLKNALGANATTGTGPYTHVMKRGASVGSMSIEKAFLDLGKYFVFPGCKVDKFSLNINGENSLVTGSMDLIGKGFSSSDTSLGAPTAVVHSPFAEFEATITEDGTPVTVLNFGLNFSNDLERVAAIGTRNAVALNEDHGSADVSLTLLFDTMDLVDKWLNETQTAVQVAFAQGAASGTFLLPAVKYFGDAIPKIKTSKGIVVELTGKAKYDSVEQTDLKATFVNTEVTI